MVAEANRVARDLASFESSRGEVLTFTVIDWRANGSLVILVESDVSPTLLSAARAFIGQRCEIVPGWHPRASE